MGKFRATVSCDENDDSETWNDLFLGRISWRIDIYFVFNVKVLEIDGFRVKTDFV